MRIFLTSLAILLTSAGGAPGAAQPASQVDTRPFVPRQISATVHLLATPAYFFGIAIGNIVVIEQSDGFVVIDSGLTAANGRTIVNYVKSLSPTKPVKAVAITHWHNDHPQGVSAIRDQWPNVRVISTRPTEAGMLGPEAYDIGYSPSATADALAVKGAKEEMANLQKVYDDPATAADRKERIKNALANVEQWSHDFRGTYIVPPTETFERELLIDDRDQPVKLMYLGKANTDGDLVAWLPKQKIIATGDIVVSPYPYGFGSFPGDWIETLKKIKALGFTTLLPGHGQPQTDTTYVDNLIAAITDIRAQVGPLTKQGLSKEEIAKKVDFSKSAALFGPTERDKAQFQSLFASPMTTNVYEETRGDPVLQTMGPGVSYTETPPKSRAKRHKT